MSSDERKTQGMRHLQIPVGDHSFHVVEAGAGPAVLLCHGFPDLWRGWRRQITALAIAGYRAIALDMRGYGRSFAPADPHAYTPLHTVGDLVAILDVLGVQQATVVGHDFGANVAWNAAMMRPDLFVAVFGISVPFLPRGEKSFIQQIRDAGQENFYMFRQMAPEAAEAWADAAATYPALLYWSSGSPPKEEQWDPFDADRAMYRKAPVDIPSWADRDDIAYAVAEFSRTGFQGGLNYYHSIQTGFDLTAAYRGAKIARPSFFLTGALDGVRKIRATTEEELRAWLPDLRGFVEVPDVGHWPQWEAPETVNAALLSFLKSLD